MLWDNDYSQLFLLTSEAMSKIISNYSLAITVIWLIISLNGPGLFKCVLFAKWCDMTAHIPINALPLRTECLKDMLLKFGTHYFEYP